MFLRNVGKFLQGFMTSYVRRSFYIHFFFMQSQLRNLKHAPRDLRAARRFISSGPLADIFPVKGCRSAQFRKFLEFKFVTWFVLETLVILRWYSIILLNKEITNNEVSNSVIIVYFDFVFQVWNIFNCAFNSNWNAYRHFEFSGIRMTICAWVRII
jgi:hypothetical protein